MHLYYSVLTAGHLEDAIFVLAVTFFIIPDDDRLLQTGLCCDVSEILKDGKLEKNPNKMVY